MKGSIAGLAFDRVGQGPPLLLLHGTNSSRRVWDTVLAELTPFRLVIALDLPGHGQSHATSAFTPAEWARDVAAALDYLDLEKVPVVGHSCGGWCALELAKLGRASAVLALCPAGLWRQQAPARTNVRLRASWRAGQILQGRLEAPLRHRSGRRVLLRGISSRPADIPPEAAITLARTLVSSEHFPEHFAQTRRLRFHDGSSIPAGVPVHVVWGAKDRIAVRGSRRAEELPKHAAVETLKGCGHMVMWDAPGRVVQAALMLGGDPRLEDSPTEPDGES